MTVSEGGGAVQNVLTVNGDGLNDTWVLPNEFSFKDDVEVQIYGSNGEVVLKTKNYKNNWPNDMPITKSGIFYYIIIKQDILMKKGTISVIK